jgi:uncharacterized SAM-binding protein YcdF (DUF218 family)
MYWIRHLAALAVTPHFWLGACLLRAAWQLRRARPRSAGRWLAAAVATWWLPATPWAEYLLCRPLESAYPARRAEDYPKVDAIVALGGTTGRVTGPVVEAEEVNGCRVQTAAKLYHAGRAPLVFVTGSPYQRDDGAPRSEAEDMRELLAGLGVPAAAVLADGRATNTLENAEGAARMLPQGPRSRILLATSATHMPRAMALFRKLGFDPIPAPCGFYAPMRPSWGLGLLPGPQHSARVGAALKEYLGRLVSWARGEA